MKKIFSLFAAMLVAGSMMATLPDNPKWVATSLADIADGSTIIIISNSTEATNIALPAAGAGSSNPPKVACTISTTDGVSTITPPTGKTLQQLAWTIKKKTSTWQFYVEGSSTNLLYLSGTSSNTALRVGSGSSNNEFVMGSGGKLLKVSTASRYVGPNDNNGSDWRTYSSETATNYKGAVLTFYVMQAPASCEKSISIAKASEAPEHGSFTLSRESDEICIDEGNASTTVTADPDEHYHLATVNATAGTVGTISGNTCEITDIDADAVITVTFAEDAKHNVIWNVNGDNTDKVAVYEGEQPEWPATPSAPEGFDATSTNFYGWATSAWSGKLNDLSDKTIFTKAEELPVMGDDDVEYFAVFAKKTTQPGEKDVIYSFELTAVKWTAEGAQTLNEVEWTLATDATYFGYDNQNGRGQQVGSGSAPATEITLSTSDLEGKIKEVKVYSSCASSSDATISVSVNSEAYLSGESTSESLTTTNTAYTFTGSKEGEIVISWAQTTSKALYFKQVDVKHTVSADVDVYSDYMTTKSSAPTAVDNTEASVKAVKFIENGQLFIEKNGHVYNVQGQIVR